jgi:hypothetical protein
MQNFTRQFPRLWLARVSEDEAEELIPFRPRRHRQKEWKCLGAPAFDLAAKGVRRWQGSEYFRQKPYQQRSQTTAGRQALDAFDFAAEVSDSGETMGIC